MTTQEELRSTPEWYARKAQTLAQLTTGEEATRLQVLATLAQEHAAELRSRATA